MDRAKMIEIDRKIERTANALSLAIAAERRAEGQLAECQDKVRAGKPVWDEGHLERYLAAAAAATGEARAAAAVAAEKYEGWTRWYIVEGGHVHNGFSCSTCYPTTRYGWLIEEAGNDLESMVAKYGETMCTVCFPEAPTLPRFHDSDAKRASDAEKAERADAKAARKAKADAKKISEGHRIALEAVGVRRSDSDTFANVRSTLKSRYHYGPRATGDVACLELVVREHPLGGPTVALKAAKSVLAGFRKSLREYHNNFNLTEEQVARSKADLAENIERLEAIVARLK